MLNFINERELRVVGMSRSGNHAIIQWILQQCDGRYCFLNAVQADYNPFMTTRPIDSPEGERAFANYPGFNLQRELAGHLSPKDLLIYSHEDEPLRRVASMNFERYHHAFVGPSRSRLDVLVLRDPFNLFASRLRSGYGWVSPKIAIHIWKQHAREYLRLTRFLRYGPMLINYNLWATSRDYRHGIAHSLGLRFTDAGVDSVASCAGGSSFDGLRFNGKASKMRVLHRWRSCRRDPNYIALFSPEILELSEQIFGRIPGTQTLLAPPEITRAG